MKPVFLALLLALSAGLPSFAHGPKSHAPGTVVKQEQLPWGIAADKKTPARTIELKMLDTMRFVPDRITVKQGETVRLVLRNTGQVMHELVLGTRPVLDEHAALMAKFPGMEHDEPYMAHVAPGKSGEIRWTFNRPGEFDFACLIAGHYQAGMVGRIVVTAK
ncbi:cupredoxin domain-containing protein [Inhella gelatinilytica]|uniref:Cupredoxin family protein n=1 Tax=Inhella gelatinilytica TaxID=2795030 RepID=A0A931IZ35_9BURK|nr:cupredoxin family protein [Inhella gelatinilytica]MBH9553650.1 cupredoxin family protein [Inhella gelatinilytica]